MEISETTPSTHCNFLSLPPEIRHDIYTRFFQDVIIYPRIRGRAYTSPPPPDRRTYTSILQTCRRINEEATPILFTYSTFDLGHHLSTTYCADQESLDLHPELHYCEAKDLYRMRRVQGGGAFTYVMNMVSNPHHTLKATTYREKVFPGLETGKLRFDHVLIKVWMRVSSIHGGQVFRDPRMWPLFKALRCIQSRSGSVTYQLHMRVRWASLDQQEARMKRVHDGVDVSDEEDIEVSFDIDPLGRASKMVNSQGWLDVWHRDTIVKEAGLELESS